MKNLKSLIVFMLFVFVGYSMSSAQTADEILKKHFENTGGIDKWKTVKTIKSKGIYGLPAQGIEVDFEATQKFPNKLRRDMSFGGQEIVMGFDGKEMWMINPFQGGTEPQLMPEEQTKVLSEQIGRASCRERV